MTGLELAKRMSASKVSVDELAAWMNRRPDEVINWMASERSLRTKLAGQLEWHLGLRLIEERMRTSGLPTCPWLEAQPDPPWSNAKALERYSAEIDAHAATCPICKQRTAFAATLPPPPPFPIRSYEGFLDNVNPWFAWMVCGGLVCFFVGLLARGHNVLAEDYLQVGLLSALAWVGLVTVTWVAAKVFLKRGA